MRTIFTGITDQKYVIVLGDFNMNVNKLTESHNISYFMQTMYQCTQYIQENITRQNTRIDLVLAPCKLNSAGTILSCFIP